MTPDNDLYTDWDRPASEIVTEKAQESEEEETGDTEVISDMCTLTEAQGFIQRIKKLAGQLGDVELMNSAVSTEGDLCTESG